MRSKTQFDYFDHDADIGIMGRGESLEEAFIQAAIACFSIMIDLTQINSNRKIIIEFSETDIEFALVTWLNQLIAQARINELIFNRFQLKRDNNNWYGEAFGAPWPANIDRGTEVKGATLTGLSVKKINGTWEAKCVVDV